MMKQIKHASERQQKCAVIYARYSSNRQREESIEGQIRECNDFAARNDLSIVHTYIDRAMSAKTAQRPDFLQMIQDSKKGLFDYVIVYQLDRFSRDRYDSATYKHKLKKNGVKVLSAKENITDDPSGIILESMLEGYAEYYSAELSQKVRRGMLENVLEGKWPGGNIALGLRLDENHRLQIDEPNAALVRQVRKKFLAGQTRASLVRFLNRKHYKTSSNKRFTETAITYILTNDIYVGTFHYGGKTYENFCPAISTKEEHEAIKCLLEQVKRNARAKMRVTTKKEARKPYALVGKAFCGNCGNTLVGSSGTSRNGDTYTYDVCSGRVNGREKLIAQQKKCSGRNISQNQLESMVYSTTMWLLSDTQTINTIAEAVIAYDKTKPIDTELKYWESKVQELSPKIRNLVQAIENGVISETLLSSLTQYEKEKKELEIKIAKKKVLSQEKQLTKDFIKYYLTHLLPSKKNTADYKFEVFQTFVRRIDVFSDHVSIQYNCYKNMLHPDVDLRLTGSNKTKLVHIASAYPNQIFVGKGFFSISIPR